MTSYDASVYSGTAILIGSSSTAGTLYNVTGSFAAPDSNNEKIVRGRTQVIVGIKGSSGRGGGNTYTLVSGNITMVQTSLDVTTTTVICNPASFSVGSYTICTASVVDLAGGQAPTGYVVFRTSFSYLGTFSPTKCAVSSGSCSVRFYPRQAGSIPVYATYKGDSLDYKSSSSTEVYPTGSS